MNEAKQSLESGGPSTKATRPADSLFPPYGYINNTWQQDVESRRVPMGFQVDGRPGTPLEWQLFLEGETKELARFLWPRYDRANHRWEGRAAATMEAPTRADLRLMRTLSLELPKAPHVTSAPIQATHLELFEIEDESPPGATVLYPTLDAYLPNVPADTLTALKTSIRKMSVDFGPAPLRYKYYMQRPRPYQVAFAAGEPFVYEFGRSAVSPALPSGHCLQGLVRHAASFLANRNPLVRRRDAVAAFAQHAVDFGDRRVFAGVHYPSDNIASWYLALRLCNVLYGHVGQAAKHFMWQAIGQSHVYTRLTDHVSGNKKSVYAIPLQRLRKEAETPVKTPEG